MIEKYKSTIKSNSKRLLAYEFFYVLLVSLITTPTVVYLYNLIIKKQTISLTGIFILSLLLSFSLLLLLFNKVNLITILDKSKHNYKIKFREIIKISLNKFPDLFSKKNFLLILLYVVYLPFLYLDLIGYYVIKSLEYININNNIIILIGVIYVIIILLLSKYLYVWHYAVIEDKNFKSAKNNSKKLIKNNLVGDLSRILLVQLGILPIIVLMIIMYNQIVITHSLLTNSGIINSIIWLLNILVLTIYIVLVNTSISTMFYTNKKEKNERIKQIKNSKTNKIKLIYKPIAFTYIVFVTIISINYMYHELIVEKRLINKVEITAHRGASINYPENTILSFVGAKQEKADWIELDVRQTKDKQIVVYHDDSLNRIGIDRYISDMTYEELSNIDYGKYFNTKYSNVRIPLLVDAIEFAKSNNIKLNIDLKTVNQEDDLESSVVELIEKYNFVDSCVITTPSYRKIRNIKRLNPNIKTAYLAYAPSESLINLSDADAISINIMAINNYIVDLLHKAGKEVYVWTINDETAIKEMISLDVDNIITDNVLLTQDLIEQWTEKISN